MGESLGGHVYKKRIALHGRGKSGGARTLLVYRVGDVAFFIYGFAKKDRANIGKKDLAAMKKLAEDLLSYGEQTLNGLIATGEFVEVRGNGEINT